LFHYKSDKIAANIMQNSKRDSIEVLIVDYSACWGWGWAVRWWWWLAKQRTVNGDLVRYLLLHNIPGVVLRQVLMNKTFRDNCTISMHR